MWGYAVSYQSHDRAIIGCGFCASSCTFCMQDMSCVETPDLWLLLACYHGAPGKVVFLFRCALRLPDLCWPKIFLGQCPLQNLCTTKKTFA